MAVLRGESAGHICRASRSRGLMVEKIVWALIFVWGQKGSRRTSCRVGWRTLQPPFSQVVFSCWLVVREGSCPRSRGFCLAGVEMQPRQRHVGMREGELCERGQQTGLLLCSTVFQNWVQGSSLVRTLWEPPRFGAPAEQPRESLYSWGTARTTSPPWPSAQASWASAESACMEALCCLERGPPPLLVPTMLF